jgi:hypothetical protein
MTARDLKVAAGVVLAAAILGVAPGVSASGPPPPTSDAGSRGKPTGAVRSEAARLVTGSPVHLQSVVVGTPVTTAATSSGRIVAWGCAPGTDQRQCNVPAPNSGFVPVAGACGNARLGADIWAANHLPYDPFIHYSSPVYPGNRRTSHAT